MKQCGAMQFNIMKKSAGKERRILKEIHGGFAEHGCKQWLSRNVLGNKYDWVKNMIE